MTDETWEERQPSGDAERAPEVIGAESGEPARVRAAEPGLVRSALWAAATAAAATGGALVAFGLHVGGASEAFTHAGRLMLGIAATEGAAATARAFVAGALAHLGGCLLWGAVFAAIVRRRRASQSAVTAALLATAVYSAGSLWLPRVLRLGDAIYATQPQRMLLHALLAGGLWVGIRIALHHRRGA